LGCKRGQPLYLNISESPSPKHISHQVWMKLAKWLLRRSRLKEKVNRRTDARTDAGQIAMAIAHLSLLPGELKKYAVAFKKKRYTLAS